MWPRIRTSFDEYVQQTANPCNSCGPRQDLLHLLLVDHLLGQEVVQHIHHVQVIHNLLPTPPQNIFVGFLHNCEIVPLYLSLSHPPRLNLTSSTDKKKGESERRVFVCSRIWADDTWYGATGSHQPAADRSQIGLWLNCHSAAAPLFVLGFVEFSPPRRLAPRKKAFVM